MGIDVDDLDLDRFSDISGYLNWAQEAKLWDGRSVSYVEASELSNEVMAHIHELLKTCNESSFERFAVDFAYLGCDEENLEMLLLDIKELDLSNEDRVIQAGFFHKVWKFCKKHKKEIFIGAAIVTAATVVGVVAASAIGAAAARGSSRDSRKGKNDKEPLQNPPPPKDPPKEPVMEDPSPVACHKLNLDDSAPSMPASAEGKLLFGESGLWLNGTYTDYRTVIMDSHPIADSIKSPIPSKIPCAPQSNQSWMGNFMTTIGKGMIDPDLLDPDAPLPSTEQSSFFTTLGKREPHIRIGGINGMHTVFDEALAHANYLSSFAHGQSIDWVHNASHGLVLDLSEIALLNFQGISPNTAELLRNNWESFHQANLDRPNAKYLQFCHSQGALHVRNALMQAPKEIQDRVIVVAVAPAVLLTDEICYDATNIACKGDVIPYSELSRQSSMDADEPLQTKRMEELMERYKDLILVDPVPETEYAHDFQNPAFKKKINDIIEDYIKSNGESQCKKD